ncbi:MAG: aminotransferase class I/II-fold pyridoxal phosphate-dependent enzyme [Bacteroidota bacterium]
MKKETSAIRTQTPRSQFQEHSTPLYLTSSFVFEDTAQMHATFTGELERNAYSRYSNPNVQELIDKVCAMEGADSGLAAASGMAAIFATLAGLLQSGDHVLASSALFGSTYKLLENVLSKWGITHDYVPPTDVASWAQFIRPETKLIYLETPSNPMLEIVDLAAAKALAAANDCLLIVDNCFATPYLQQPIQFGADLVIHSSTKFMDGQGRVLGGLTAGRQDLIDKIQFFMRHTGPSLSPFNAWVISKSLETLALRMDRHCTSALTIAQFLEQHPKVDKVIYPFLDSHLQCELAKQQMLHGEGVVSFEVKGDGQTAQDFIDCTSLFSITSNLGDSRSILTHPIASIFAKTSPEKRLEYGVKDNLVRLSVGLENVEDLMADLDRSL